MNQTQPCQVIEVENENKTELIEEQNCTDGKVNLISQNEEASVQKGNSMIFSIFYSVLLTIAFVSLFAYVTLPKKKIKLNKFNHSKSYENIKYDIREF